MVASRETHTMMDPSLSAATAADGWMPWGESLFPAGR